MASASADTDFVGSLTQGGDYISVGQERAIEELGELEFEKKKPDAYLPCTHCSGVSLGR